MSKNTGRFLWEVKQQTSFSNIKTVKVSIRYCPGIFSKLVGVLTLNNFDIFNAISYRQDDKTSHIFNVRAIPGQVLDDKGFVRAENQLEAVLSGKLDLSLLVHTKMPVPRIFNSGELLQTPHEVIVRNEIDLTFSTIEVHTYDFPGVLFRISDALFRSGFYVWTAKISTKGNRVYDVFYVKDFKDQQIKSPEQVAAVKTAIKKALSI
ncbi:ACT domain-containing protein [Desulfonema magnum]|uniref:ACT domain-containing protein n=2 Tax=Desulfonema magnum TaxID=45655 RepID=A0A975BWI5_9BACT|nr:ACT domain-containing protein [Desulfonema magnum]